MVLVVCVLRSLVVCVLALRFYVGVLAGVLMLVEAGVAMFDGAGRWWLGLVSRAGLRSLLRRSR